MTTAAATLLYLASLTLLGWGMVQAGKKGARETNEFNKAVRQFRRLMRDAPETDDQYRCLRANLIFINKMPGKQRPVMTDLALDFVTKYKNQSVRYHRSKKSYLCRNQNQNRPT